jgi:SAM-dependent methyltransferase
MPEQQNAAQQAFWSDQAGPKWVRYADAMNDTLEPVLDLVLEAAGLSRGDHVLDIGCGTGQSLRRAAEIVGSEGEVLGVDISSSMLGAAAERLMDLPQVKTLLADAASHAFMRAQHDAMISRFGVMFFEDPVAAFANIATGLKPGARLTFASWSLVEENPWFYLPAKAAKAALGAPPAVDPDAPGPFAFREIDKVTGILAQAGLADITASANNLLLTPSGTLAETAEFNSFIGPAARTIEHFEASEAQIQDVRNGIEELFARFMTPDGLRVPAEINLFQARVPG